MDTIPFFLTRHEALHQWQIPYLLEPLSEDDLRKRPAPSVTPIAWMLWHMARVEDAGINRFVVDQPQVLNEDWQQKLNISPTDYGTGMSEEAVEVLVKNINLTALRQYQEAVAKSTVEALAKLDQNLLNDQMNETRVRQIIIEEGIGGAEAEWVIPHYVAKTKGWCLLHFCLTHNYYHLGQAFLVRKMLGHAPMQ